MTNENPSSLSSSSISNANTVKRVRFAWRLTTASYLCLFGVLLVWHLKVLPFAGSTASWMLAPLLIPLLIAGPGLFKGKAYTYKWMSLAVWLWFTHGAMEAWTHREIPALAGIASLEPLLSVTLFIGIVMFLKAQRQLSAPPAQN